MTQRFNYYVQIADNAFILSHRLGEYAGKGPFLEEDLANTNVALDLLGMAETLYEEATKYNQRWNTADAIAFRREENQYRNCLLVEQPNNDFAFIIVRQFLTDAFHFYFLSELMKSKDQFLATFAIKALKEVTYHLRRSSEWMIRLGSGTDTANKKTQHALDSLWKFAKEFFVETSLDKEMLLEGTGVNLATVYSNWNQKTREVFYLSNLKYPQSDYQFSGGKEGRHTEHMGHLLCELQYLHDKYPTASW